MTNDHKAPVARIGMLIRKPAATVFQAFIDPIVTTKFWFTESSGVLREGATVTWTWAMYNASTQVRVNEIVQDRQIVVTWDTATTPTTVKWTLSPQPQDQTYVEIVNHGFTGSDTECCIAAIDAAGGFALVLAGAKAWLEHGIELNLVGDRFPGEMSQHV